MIANGGVKVNADLVDIVNDLSVFISEFHGVKLSDINEDASINDDMGMDGDDAHEFMEAFAKKYDVDLKNVQWERYFGSEECNPFALFLFPIYFFKKDRVKPRPLTVLRLAIAVQDKKW